MTSTINADKIMNGSGDQDSGLDLLVNDQVKIKTANTDRITVTDATTTIANDLAANTIKHTGGTTGLTIDSSGRVFKSVTPRFSVYRGGSEQFVNTSNMSTVGVAIDWTTAEVNNGGANFDLSNNRFQAPATGMYRFDFSVLAGLLIPSSGVYWGTFIFTKNGSTGVRIPGTPLTYFESYNSSGSANAGQGGSGRNFKKVVGGGFA